MRRHHRKPKVHKCEKDGCAKEGKPCYLPDWGDEPSDGKPDFYYCYEHIHSQGFCKMCGQFWAGVESFDFGNGYCDNCNFALRDDMDDFQREDDFDSVSDYYDELVA